MPEIRHPALRESVWAACVAHSGTRVGSHEIEKQAGGDIARPQQLQAYEDINMAKKSFKVGRSARTGRFTTVKKAQTKKSTHVVETIKRK